MDPIIFEDLLNKVGQDYKLTKKSDIYSLGVLFWELTSGGLLPFENKEHDEHDENKAHDDYGLMHEIRSGTRETPVPNTNPKFAELYQSK